MLGIIIPVLEVVTLVFVGLLVHRTAQVYRQFLIDNPVKVSVPTLTERGASEDAEAIVVAPAQTSVKLNPVVVEDTDQAETQLLTSASLDKVMVEDSAPVPESVSNAEELLNDYIGEFFAEPKKPDISSFKAEPTASALKAEAQTQEKEDMVSSHVMETVGDDDSIITVSSEPETGVKIEDTDDVMSDKVVRAMLNEAKLVCAS